MSCVVPQCYFPKSGTGVEEGSASRCCDGDDQDDGGGGGDDDDDDDVGDNISAGVG